MDYDRQGHHYVNGMSAPRQNEKKKEHNYKLVVDPFLHKGNPQKVYRFDGVMPGDNRVVSTRDPRPRLTRLWTRQQQADLPVPKFKYDEYYVGTPPPKDVTFTNLNDNINRDFLENMCKGCGKIEECKIYYHPKTKKHLGIGKTLFMSSKAARACVEKLNQTSKMGNIINVFIDTMGKERNRLIEELTTEQVKRQPSPERRLSGVSESQFPVPETEAYDPSDAFGEMAHPLESEYTPSVETDYSGYSVPQSEMSFSSQDTGYSSAANSAGYHRDNYNQYPMDGPSAHHGGNNYYPRNQGHYRDNHHHHHNQSRHGHRSSHIIHHQAPSTPAHRHTPQPTPHYSNRDMENSHYGSFYAPPPPVPKPMFDRPPPPLPPEPPRSRRSDYEEPIDRPSKYSNRKKKNREPKPPPRPPSPEPPSEGPRLESLESRIQSLLCSNSHGLSGSPEHTSSSSQDESTPARLKTEEPSFEFYPPPATQPLPPLPELGIDEVEASPRDGHLPRPVSRQGEAEFESQVLDSQTVVEETIDNSATPSTESVQNGTAPQLPDQGRASKREEKEEEDDRMSLSSISSGEEKLEINPPLPPSTPAASTPTKTNFTQSPQTPSTSSASAVPVSWTGNMMTSPFLGSPPPGYQSRLSMDNSPQKLEEEDPNYHTFTTVLDKFVKELKQILQKDLCKKMVENSAFKSFENWWDGEVLKSKKTQLAEKETEVLPSTSTAVKPKTEKIKPELSSSLASLFDSRERGNIESSSMGYGGFLGIRGGMPKLPSFKRKFPRPSPVIEEDEDSRKTGNKSAEDEESDEEISRSSKQKAIISDSEESEESSDEEKEEDISADEDEEGSDDSSEEEEESEESEEESSESEDSDAQEEEEDEIHVTEELATAKKDTSQEKLDNKRVEEKMSVDEDSEDEEVDVGTETEASFTKPETLNKEASDVSAMETDDSAAESSEKESPEKRPLSPILEEREKEEQTAVKGVISKSAQPSTTSTETSASSADSSAMDSDSSALGSVSPTKKSVPKQGKGRGSSSSASSKALLSATDSANDSVEVVFDPNPPGHSNVLVEEEVHDSEASHKLSESEAELRSHFMVPAIAEHDYFSFPPAVATEESTADSDRTESADEESETLSEVLVDHNYSLPPIVEEVRIGKAILKKEAVISPKPAKETKKRVRAKKSKDNMLADITNRTEDKVSRELANLLTPAVVKPVPKFKARTFQEERQIFFDIYDKGISEEDVKYLKRSYDELIQSDDPNFYWLNDILWVDHTHTDIKDVLPVPPKKKKKTEDHVPKPHKTGCARSEGYYKLTMMEKAGYLRHAHNLQLQQKAAEDLRKVQEGKKAQTSREARHHNRRLQTTYSDLETDLLRFNQLKFRKKQLKFAKSGIHDWGLFALEPIASEEMVIEYVGQVVRQSIADEREKRYEAIGIGSSYLFRVDSETIIDATRTGNLARFINHSCNPNCYAKIITVEAEKKIVIYSKRDIDVNEEITYDYKFPIEDEKIPCLCMAPGCRGTLN